MRHHHRDSGGFTLLEVMISLAIAGGLLVTLIYTLNYHLGVAERHAVVTTATNLARQKLLEMERTPAAQKGDFPEPYASFSYETVVKASSFPGMSEVSVTVKSGREEMTLRELIRSSR